jgi:hypothetical protein
MVFQFTNGLLSSPEGRLGATSILVNFPDRVKWVILGGALCGLWEKWRFVMWRCPNCGEQIGDEFDACWKCGTVQDGDCPDFCASKNETVPFPRRDGEPPPNSEEEREADRLLNERLAEVCSAGNIVEADGLCELLEEAGIQARVVGEGPGVAAAGLALGENVSPRIWVYDRDLARAREVIEQWRSRQVNEPIGLTDSEPPPESERPVEAEYAELPSDVRLRFLSQGFFIAGLVCILIGAVWAWRNSTMLSTYSGTAIARFNNVFVSTSMCVAPPRERDLPPGNVAAEYSFRYTYSAQYVYIVNGEKYKALLTVDRAENAPMLVDIRYNPRFPANNIVGSITPPWMILLFAAMVGVFFCFVGYQFR